MDELEFIGCINLVDSEDRTNKSKLEFSKINILEKVHFLNAKKHKLGGKYGCFDSHLKMYRMALDKNVNYALIFEDDFILKNKTINESINNALKCINKYKNFYRICLHNSGTFKYKKTPIKGVYESQFIFMRCYIISKLAMESALKLGVTNNHIDLEYLITWQKKKNFTIKPSLTIDRAAYSTNSYNYKSKFVNALIKSRYFYILEYIWFKTCKKNLFIQYISFNIFKDIYKSNNNCNYVKCKN